MRPNFSGEPGKQIPGPWNVGDTNPPRQELPMTPPDILKMPKWTKKDGPAPFVYADKPPGHRCAWTCTWILPPVKEGSYAGSYGGKQITPASWGPCTVPENMSVEALKAELADISTWPHVHFAPKAAQWLQSNFLQPKDEIAIRHWRVHVEGLIAGARVSYPGFTHWTITEKGNGIVEVRHRPGW
jgi:hypothetical protein